ncbi:MAG: hypothetical protein AAFR67_07455, partial [Chloroflexota bacterium]
MSNAELQRSFRAQQTRKLAFGVVRGVLVILLILFTLFPIVWVASASINPAGTLASQTLVPQNVDSIDDLATNYQALFEDPQVPFWRWVGNSSLSHQYCLRFAEQVFV